MRRICGWEKKSDIPSESTFSRAFTEFAKSQLPACVHEAMIRQNLSEEIIHHISRDSTEIEAREKPVKERVAEAEVREKKLPSSDPKSKTPPRKRGRPKKGEEPVKEPTRLERQKTMTLAEMLQDLPQRCDVGTKKNSKGYKE